MKTLLFAPETFNLAETTRMIEVAKECQSEANCVFMGYSRKFADFIEEAGFEFNYLAPHLTETDIKENRCFSGSPIFIGEATPHRYRKACQPCTGRASQARFLAICLHPRNDKTCDPRAIRVWARTQSKESAAFLGSNCSKVRPCMVARQSLLL